MSRKEILECFHDEVRQCDEELDEGKITPSEHKRFLENLNNNLNTDLAELDHQGE